MSKNNGKTANKPSAIELTLDSGLTILVKPLSPYTRQAIHKQLADKFPYPNDREFEEQIGDSPGAVIPADDKTNVRYEEYEALKSEADTKRTRGYFEAIVTLCVNWLVSKEELINQYEQQRSDLSALFTLPDDKWLATLYHCLCASQGDINEILQVAHEQLDIMEDEPTEDEIHSAWRIFRTRVSRAERGRFDNLTSRFQEVSQLRRKVQSDTGSSDSS